MNEFIEIVKDKLENELENRDINNIDDTTNEVIENLKHKLENEKSTEN